MFVFIFKFRCSRSAAVSYVKYELEVGQACCLLYPVNVRRYPCEGRRFDASKTGTFLTVLLPYTNDASKCPPAFGYLAHEGSATVSLKWERLSLLVTEKMYLKRRVALSLINF